MTDPRVDRLYQERYQAHVRRIDRLFAYLLIGQWLFGIGLALWFSPYGWHGRARSVHVHLWVAIFLGGAVSAGPVSLAFLRPGWWVTRHSIAVAQMLWSALLIHLTGGRIETHFHVFGSLAFLAFYRDWKVLVPATIVVALDHLVRQFLWPESVYGIINPEWWRFLEHAFWVVFEDAFLLFACLSSRREMYNFTAQQIRVESAERIEREMEIAARIQTGILPRSPQVRGLEVAAEMRPASEVGGDYYDVIAVEDGCWISIGDVAGHGLPAGMVMLQAQSALAALVASDPEASPCDVLCSVNRVLHENVRKRMGSDEYMTLSLLRYHHDGRLVIAGAHEEAVIFRAATGRCETLPVEGTWLGATADIRPFTTEVASRLELGDLLILYTDGITEARNDANEQFGLNRLCDAVTAGSDRSPAAVRDRVLAATTSWTGRRDDDMTILVLHHHGEAATANPRDDVRGRQSPTAASLPSS